MESSSLRFCRTNSRRSSDSSCGRALIQSGHEWRETFAIPELVAELVCAILAGDFPDAHPVQQAVGRIILLNEDGRVGSGEAVAETFGVVAVAKSSPLHGKESGRWVS